MKERKIGYDFLRIISIFLVIAIHSNVAYLGKNEGSLGWFFVMIATSVCTIAVPLFFMVSGALLLDTDSIIPAKDLFFKRILKQAIPFIIWSVIYVFARIIMGKIPFASSSFTALLYEPAYYQFWFMYSLFAIYLLLPALQAVVLKLERRHLEYILILWLVFSLTVPLLSKIIPGFKISEHVDLVLCEGYIGYFLLGFYLKKYHATVSPKRAIVFGLSGLLSTGVLSVIEYFVSGEDFKGHFYQSYLTPFVAVAAAGIFVSLQNLSFKKDGTLCKSLKLGSELAIGVFYVHMLVMAVLEHIGLLADTSFILLICKTAVSYIASLATAFVISRIPYVRKILMGMN